MWEFHSLNYLSVVPDGGPYVNVVDGIEWIFTVNCGNAAVGTPAGHRAVSMDTVGDLVIPSELGGLKVTRIENSAFDCCWELTSITIPASVSEIGECVFVNCLLSELIVDSSNGSYVSKDGVLYTHDMLELVSCPRLKEGDFEIPESVTHIRQSAFSCCSLLTNIVLPEGLAHIGDSAFLSCSSLTNMTIPVGVSHIGERAFTYCENLMAFSVSPENECYAQQEGLLYDKGLSKLVCCPGGVSGTLELPSGLTAIGAYAFGECFGLSGILMPSTVTNIGYSAFWGCSGLKDLAIPCSVIEIGSWAFTNCQNLNPIDFEGAPPIGFEQAMTGCEAPIRYNVAYRNAWHEVLMSCGFTNAVAYLPEGQTGFSAPESALASEDIPGVVRLDWSEVTLADSYRIYRATRSNFDKATLVAEVSNGCEYEDHDVTSVPTYYYWISSVNETGETDVGEMLTGWCSDPLQIENDDLPTATELVAYVIQLQGAGGVTPYFWSMAGDCGFVESESASDYGFAGEQLTDDQLARGIVDLPFAFPFGGSSYTQVCVDRNGMLRLGSWDSAAYVEPVWCGMCAWVDGGGVFMEESATEVVFRWKGETQDGNSIDASVTLHADGCIDFAFDSESGIDEITACIADESWSLTPVVGSDRVVIMTPSRLPDGLTLSDDGVLSGVPARTGNYRFAVEMTGASGGDAVKFLSLTVAENANRPPVIDSCWQETNGTVRVFSGSAEKFGVVARDPEGGDITYRWYLDGADIGSEFQVYEPTDDDMGEHELVCRIEDDLWRNENAVVCRWQIRVAKCLYVDAASGRDSAGEEESEPTGRSQDDAFASVERAIESASDGDVIYVAPGVYAGFSTLNTQVDVVAVSGPASTVLMGSGWPLAVSDGNVRGFTITGAELGANGGTFENCVISNCTKAAMYCTLVNCLITCNHGIDEVVWCCDLYDCTVAGNTVDYVDGGAVSYCALYNCIVWDNVYKGDGSPANLYCSDTGEEYSDENTVRYSCTLPLQDGEGNVAADPKFIDPFSGDLRLRIGSPCLDAGSADFIRSESDVFGSSRIQREAPDMGAIEGDGVVGHLVSVKIFGHGMVNRSTVLVSDGGTCTLSVVPGVRPFEYFETNGVFATSNAVLNVTDVREDITVKAHFRSLVFHVDTNAGSDDAFGLGWDDSMKSIQQAVNSALEGETILVRPGVYASVVVGGLEKPTRLTIEAIAGPDSTIIDGGSTSSCFYVGNETFMGFVTNASLIGFTLRNGHGSPWGGGACGGTLKNCRIVNNRAYGYGGGLFMSRAEDSLIAWNDCLTDAVDRVWGPEPNTSYGGGVYDSHLVRCTVYGNRSATGGAGVCSGTLQDCIVWNNESETASGVCGWVKLYRSCVDVIDDDWGEYEELYGDDPLFVDSAHGDFRLVYESPYVHGGMATIGAFQTPRYPAPDAPGDVAASSDRDGFVHVSWSGTAFSAAYRVYRATEGDAEMASCIAETAVCSYDDHDVSGQTYYYWITATNECGESVLSTMVCGKTDTPPVSVPADVFECGSSCGETLQQWLVRKAYVGDTQTKHASQIRSLCQGLNVRGEPIWQDYVAGTDPTDEKSRFTSSITVSNGLPVIRWNPNLNENASTRLYRVWGKTSMTNAWEWPSDSSVHKFFKVEVSMPDGSTQSD